MKVYVFDLLPYDKHFDQNKADRYIPYPLPRECFDPETAARTYEEHLNVWTEMDRLGFDGVGLNEHHTTPHGLMNSPNMMAAVAAQRTKKLKFLILGNILPIHNPMRIAEELAMADCLSRGRILSGFARGVPREYNVYGVPMKESRARFEEAVEIILKAWKDPSFSYDGKFWSYKDTAIWPRPFQQPHPPIWIPLTGSKETMDWVGRYGFNTVLSHVRPGLTEDVIGYLSKAMAKNGHQVTPDKLCIFTDAWVADSAETAIAEASPYYLYFVQMLWHHGSSLAKESTSGSGYVNTSSYDYVRPENRPFAEMDRGKIANTTLADVHKRVSDKQLAWGPAKEVTEQLIDIAENAGANSILLNINLGAMPNDLFMEQIRRFGRDVLPKLQAHQVKRVPAAEAALSSA